MTSGDPIVFVVDDDYRIREALCSLIASVGLRVQSHTGTSDEHRSGTAFQFSDMVGIGVGFGKNANTEAGFRFQHISNASIKGPNPGSNFYTGYVRYRF